ncbi:ABC transporter permease [Ferrimonas senticii]|uniref:ABC transporter permease n=1 Tax=Ferrimonas senticii TaxID=394566 RepID=UPI0004167EBE|nr:ABC transporter permease [Ferrimonas senticii]
MFATIVIKELRELRRDNKSFWFVVLFPTVILPLLIAGALWFGAQTVTEKHQQALRFAIIAPEQWQQTVASSLDGSDGIVWQQAGLQQRSVQEAINADQLDFVLQIPTEFAPTSMQSFSWQLHYNQTEDFGQFGRIEAALEPLIAAWQQQHQQTLGLSDQQLAGLLEPVALERVGIAAEREDIGAKAGGMLPYMLIFLALLGAMIPALDLGAGEKERGTLETLLLAPQKRSTIILAKSTVITSASIAVALLTVISGLVWLTVAGQMLAIDKLLAAITAIGWLDLTLLLLMLLPISMILAALMLAASIYARSYKEGQSYVGPVQFIAAIPAIVAIMPGVELQGGYLWTPVINVMVASKELLKGTIDYLLLVPIALTNLVTAAAMLAFCIYWVSQEKVLFR